MESETGAKTPSKVPKVRLDFAAPLPFERLEDPILVRTRLALRSSECDVSDVVSSAESTSGEPRKLRKRDFSADRRCARSENEQLSFSFFVVMA